ncbi:hypothetical protein SAVIM338S_03230 [Streptomyces avidinii]
MPGQRKRRHSRERAHRRAAAETAGPGRWETSFETDDQAQLRAYLARLSAEGTATDPNRIRIDTFCGRLVHPTTYRVSLFQANVSGSEASA